MSSTASRAFNLTGTYVHLGESGDATPIEVTPDFWSKLMTGDRYHDGRLVTAFAIEEDMTHWEMYPAGDELIYLCSGAIDAVLERPDGVQIIELVGSSAYIIPKGVWHRLSVKDAGDVLFITPGRGTEHRPV